MDTGTGSAISAASPKSRQEHDLVVTAITRGDQEGAMRAMCDHIVTVRVDVYALGSRPRDGFELPQLRIGHLARTEDL